LKIEIFDVLDQDILNSRILDQKFLSSTFKKSIFGLASGCLDRITAKGAQHFGGAVFQNFKLIR
jgi:hypothetical protein